MASGAKHVIRELEFQPHPQLPGKGEGLQISQSPITIELLNHACVVKPPSNPPKTGAEDLRVVNTWQLGESGARRGHGSPVSLPIPGPTHLFHWLLLVHYFVVSK